MSCIINQTVEKFINLTNIRGLLFLIDIHERHLSLGHANDKLSHFAVKLKYVGKGKKNN